MKCKTANCGFDSGHKGPHIKKGETGAEYSRRINKPKGSKATPINKRLKRK